MHGLLRCTNELHLICVACLNDTHTFHESERTFVCTPLLQKEIFDVLLLLVLLPCAVHGRPAQDLIFWPLVARFPLPLTHNLHKYWPDGKLKPWTFRNKEQVDCFSWEAVPRRVLVSGLAAGRELLGTCFHINRFPFLGSASGHNEKYNWYFREWVLLS